MFGEFVSCCRHGVPRTFNAEPRIHQKQPSLQASSAAHLFKVKCEFHKLIIECGELVHQDRSCASQHAIKSLRVRCVCTMQHIILPPEHAAFHNIEHVVELVCIRPAVFMHRGGVRKNKKEEETGEEKGVKGEEKEEKEEEEQGKEEKGEL